MATAEQIRVAQEGAGFVVRCPVHGRITPEPGKVWASHVAAALAGIAHAMFTFHGEGAR